MTFVDIAQILSALATTGALIFLTFQTKHARAAVVEAQRMHQLESERERRAVEFDAQRQASQLVAWPVRATVDGVYQWGVLLVNASEAPVFGVVVDRERGVSRVKGTPIPELRAKAEVLPPGQYFVGERSYWPVLMNDADTASPIAGNADFMASLEFRDSNGLSWRREPNGALGRLE